MKKTTNKGKKKTAPKSGRKSGDNAKPLQSDKALWVSVDGGKPITFHKMIKLNSEPDVEPLSHDFATRIRKLRVGEMWEGFHEADVKRVAKPRTKSSTAKLVVGKSKATTKKIVNRKAKKKK